MTPNVARLIKGFNAFNAINEITVDIWFQKFPGVPHGNDRGIADIEYTVTTPAGELIQQGRTPADGKIPLRIRGAMSVLKLVRGGVHLATYEVSATNAAFRAAGTREGQKERLRMLGYQVGRGGADHDGVDGVDNLEFERSLLDYQVDSGVVADAKPEPAVQNRLTADAGS
jgi:hypothetical protein